MGKVTRGRVIPRRGVCKTRGRRGRSKLATTARLVVCSVSGTGAGGRLETPRQQRPFTGWKRGQSLLAAHYVLDAAGTRRAFQSLSVALPAWLVGKAGWLAVQTAPKRFITKSAAGGLTRGRLHRRHTTSRDATKGRPKKQPKKEPKPGHKKGNRQKGKASLRKGRTTDKEWLATG